MKNIKICIVLLLCTVKNSWTAETAIELGEKTPDTSNAIKRHTEFDERISDQLSLNILRFAHNMAQQLSIMNGPLSKSEVFSPLSLMSALSLLLLGARGRTYDELKRLFGQEFDTQPQRLHEEFGYMLADLSMRDGISTRKRHKVNWRYSEIPPSIVSKRFTHKPYDQIIKVVNGIFVQQKYAINPTYRDVVRNIYRAQFSELDFAEQADDAKNQINEWVHSNTNGKIAQIISGQLPRNTNVVLASALYFKGSWENPFIDAATTIDNFYPDGLNNPAVKVNMMATAGVLPHYDATEHNCQIMGLPYRGNLTTMYLILPNESSRAKLQNLQKTLTAEKIDEMINKMSLKSAILAMPKMHFTHSINMKDTLSRLGILDIFAQGYSDLSLIAATPKQPNALNLRTKQMPTDRFEEAPLIFSRYSEESLGGRVKRQSRYAKTLLDSLEQQRVNNNGYMADLFVEDILHKVDFDVNEQGTEAAAATVTYLRRSGTDVVMRLEAPFLLLIRHDTTKLPLFYGIINQPDL